MTDQLLDFIIRPDLKDCHDVKPSYLPRTSCNTKDLYSLSPIYNNFKLTPVRDQNGKIVDFVETFKGKVHSTRQPLDYRPLFVG